jgi:hypothetical protein
VLSKRSSTDERKPVFPSDLAESYALFVHADFLAPMEKKSRKGASPFFHKGPSLAFYNVKSQGRRRPKKVYRTYPKTTNPPG